MRHIPYARQFLDEDDVQAVIEVLQSDLITQGPRVQEFEDALTRWTQSKYAVAVSSGTAALHLACRAAGLTEGDEGITSTISFVASANCVAYCGGKPVLTDIHPQTYNMDLEDFARKINSQTRVVIPVHFAGQSCDMEALRELIDQKEKEFNTKISIIEDASHALGSWYHQKPVGSCEFSDMAVMSFHPVKHITTGEGGVIFTNNADLYDRLKMLRTHGIVYRKDQWTCKDESILGPWYYEQQDLGYNYRMTDIQCALGISQLKKLSDFIGRRRVIVDRYNEAFGACAHVTTPFEADGCESNFHLYVLRIVFDKIGKTRSECMAYLKKEGIKTQVHYIPIHRQPYYQTHFKTQKDDYPQAETYYSECLSFPLYPQLSDEDIGYVIEKTRFLLIQSL